MSKIIYRHILPIDDQWHEFREGTVVLIHMDRNGSMDSLEVWIAHEEGLEKPTTKLRVYGTGHEVPEWAWHCESVVVGPFVWHVFEDMQIVGYDNE